MTRSSCRSIVTRRLATRPSRARPRRFLGCVWVLLALALPLRVAAQDPSGPRSGATRARLSFGGEAAVSIAPEDDAYFNYSTEAYSALRLVRLDGSAALKLGGWFSLIGDVRLLGGIGEGDWQIQPHALFARLRPSPRVPIDIQAGLIPPVFGAFSRRTYGTENPLIGLPLGYQYVTTLRADAVPISADDLLSKRGHGWLVQYPVGDPRPDHGVPFVNGLRYPAGIEVRVGGSQVEASVAVTTGTPSIPNARDVGWHPQVSARVGLRPVTGLVLGASASHGTFLSRSLTDMLGTTGAGGANDQSAFGFDVEYSRGYWIVRAEGIYSRWRLAASAPPYVASPLAGFAFDVEGRYRILPGLYAAVRLDRLDFSEICGSAECLPWDAPVRRVEAGGGYSLRRNMIVKGVYQYNWRDGSYQPTLGLASLQLLVWF